MKRFLIIAALSVTFCVTAFASPPEKTEIKIESVASVDVAVDVQSDVVFDINAVAETKSVELKSAVMNVPETFYKKEGDHYVEYKVYDTGPSYMIVPTGYCALSSSGTMRYSCDYQS